MNEHYKSPSFVRLSSVRSIRAAALGVPRAPAATATVKPRRADVAAPERRARDLADRAHGAPLALSDLAAAAGLSRYHSCAS